MNKKVLILSSSPRKGGNSETLAAAFAKGALEAGNQVETVHLREKNYGFCRGCLACLKLGHCVIRDDAVEVTAKMHDADVLVFATPVYYYSVSGQLKTMLDRANPLYNTDYAFTNAYLLATAAEDEPETVDGTRTAVQGWVDCFPRCELVDTIFAGGVNDVGDIAGHPALEKARQEAAAVAARYQAQADKEAADLAARNERLAAEREERLISAAQMEARKTVLAAKQAVMEETYAKALEKLRNLSETRYVEVLTELLLQAAPHGVGEVLFSAQDRETVGQAAVDAANGKSGGKLTLSGETAPIQGGFILKDGNVEVNCAFDTLVRLQKAETAGQVAQRLFG